MDINLELYKVFYYVATTLSFSEASRQLFISQSAVSQAVKNLEKKLGHTLFVRSTKRVPGSLQVLIQPGYDTVYHIFIFFSTCNNLF